MSLFQYYHNIIYLLLCLFPLSIFLSLRLLHLPWLTAGIGALLASHISTDGLYGIDQSSFLWRGWGLSSQLFAIIFMPMAIAYTIRFIVHSSWFIEDTIMTGIGKQFFKELKICLQKILRKNRTANLHLAKGKDNQDTDTTHQASLKNSLSNSKWNDVILAILFITLTTMGHLGLGLMVFLSIPVIAFTKPLVGFLSQQSKQTIWEDIKGSIMQTFLLALPPLFILSYWILPTLLQSAYHNISFWDPVWKFNSYGAMEVLINLFNGALFDFGRLPIFTLLIFIGFFTSLFSFEGKKTGEKNECGEQTKFCAASLPLKDRTHGNHEVGTEDASKFSFATNAFNEQYMYMFPLSLLFLFFLLLYFGSTTWDTLLYLIPSMNEFHQHRFIVGVHLMGLFLAPIGLMWIIDQATQKIKGGADKIHSKNFHTSYFILLTSLVLLICFLMLLLPPLYRQTLAYSTHNDTLISQANETFAKEKADADLLIQTIKSLPPGRVFAGRGGTWGKDFRVAETPYFMHLSTYGIPTVLWLPETWSNNSDTEQYFSEDIFDHYELYNIRYVVAPPKQTPQKFWHLIQETPSWKLYEVELSAGSHQLASRRSGSSDNNVNTSESKDLIADGSSYITVGTSPSIVFATKTTYANVVRLWIQSPYPGKKLFPELILTNKKLASKGSALRSYSQLPQFSMVDEATYKTIDNKMHSLFAEQPIYMTPWEWPDAFINYKPQISNDKQISNNTFQISNDMTIVSQSSDTDQIFRATVEIKEPCPTCVVVLKQTYHPNWHATIRKLSTNDESSTNYELRSTIDVFPSFTAIRLEKPGTYEVVFSYQPSRLKIILMISAVIVLSIVGAMFLKQR
jgi:hypothetical protein